MNYELGKMYKNGYGVFIVDGIWKLDESLHPVKVTYISGAWKDTRDSFSLRRRVEEITKETHPEEFL